MDRAPETLVEAFPPMRYRALDGHAELAVAEAAGSAGSRPARVTTILAALYAGFGEASADQGAARRVSAAGREWLLQRAALRFRGQWEWYEAPCDACGARFDLRLSLTDIPRTGAGSGFPVAEVSTSLGRRRFEAPNGGHEEALASMRDDEDPRRVFAALCGLSEAAEAEAIRFDLHDLARIDAALEAVSPDVADSVEAFCPDCGSACQARIDPLTFAFPLVETLLREVHVIASAYCWTEPEILDLPVARRRAYAELIRAERGTPLSRGRRAS
ncbi:hypothetical protein KG088_17440 [Halomonas sp. TRM85114]|uniref:hypothetical protein n=1 Tax=Halomonas jincaotanensis TaxID=2810616 RepID=UPI001BD49AB2|nr:hypothetical protein [Halomonas jincaotanensis]MBS9405394.1 hypothetical protein [Halomonas jincaotanensis]